MAGRRGRQETKRVPKLVTFLDDADYLSQQLITYLGNKRSLLQFIGGGLQRVLARLGKRKISTFDVFSGSGVVARYFKRYSSNLIVNDLERYSQVINQCYLTNVSQIDLPALRKLHEQVVFDLATNPFAGGFIQELYAPRQDSSIQQGERVFYTSRNARFLDTARQRIQSIPQEYQVYLLAPLLSQASIHANTAGVFKGFYKNTDTGRGKFGGKQADALSRILGDISLPFPVFSPFECDFHVHREDANVLCPRLGEVDLAYLDPPYNQHPYGSNYFMLNLLADYCRPTSISEVSGIPVDWNRSAYNRRSHAHESLARLVASIKAKFLMLSFNSEGFIAQAEMEQLLKRNGKLSVLETKYNTFRGSRNLSGRGLHVKEYLYLLEKT